MRLPRAFLDLAPISAIAATLTAVPVALQTGSWEGGVTSWCITFAAASGVRSLTQLREKQKVDEFFAAIDDGEQS